MAAWRGHAVTVPVASGDLPAPASPFHGPHSQQGPLCSLCLHSRSSVTPPPPSLADLRMTLPFQSVFRSPALALAHAPAARRGHPRPLPQPRASSSFFVRPDACVYYIHCLSSNSLRCTGGRRPGISVVSDGTQGPRTQGPQFAVNKYLTTEGIHCSSQ